MGTGQCITDKVKCDSGFIRNPNFPECQSKQSVCRDHPQLAECTAHPNSNLRFGKPVQKPTPPSRIMNPGLLPCGTSELILIRNKNDLDVLRPLNKCQ